MWDEKAPKTVVQCSCFARERGEDKRAAPGLMTGGEVAEKLREKPKCVG